MKDFRIVPPPYEVRRRFDCFAVTAAKGKEDICRIHPIHRPGEDRWMEARDTAILLALAPAMLSLLNHILASPRGVAFDNEAQAIAKAFVHAQRTLADKDTTGDLCPPSGER